MPHSHLTDDLRICRVKPLIPPSILIEEIPASEGALSLVVETRNAVAAALNGTDDRLVVVCGPCSIHDVEAALEYGRRLRAEAHKHRGDLIVIMRSYFEKPRTVTGWKGLINDPGLDETFAINKGLRMARQLLSDLSDMGVPVAVEFLDNVIPQYISDFVSWVAIGARTAESQIHREFASGCSMPVGFKNSTSGRMDVAIDAVRAARSSHWFPSITKDGVSAILQTTGNPNGHVILRGGSETGPNYDSGFVETTIEKLTKHGLAPRMMIDFSHGNSGKDHSRQKAVCTDVCRQVASGSNGIFGVMIESHLVEGRQDLGSSSLVYGQSVTDACISFGETVTMLDELAESVRLRREA